VQVDPFKFTLKAPGCERLKLLCDQALSKVAFNFNLRHYTEWIPATWIDYTKIMCESPPTTVPGAKVGRCGLTLSNPC